MCKENQEEFFKNLWALYAPDVTAAQGLPAAPAGRRQAAESKLPRGMSSILHRIPPN